MFISKTKRKTGRSFFLCSSAALVVGCLIGVDAEAQNLGACVRPVSMPAVPDGATATLTEMQAARGAVDAFILQGDAYVDCLAPYTDNPLVEQIRQQMVFEMDLVAGRFNDALCTFSDGAQCVLQPNDAYAEDDENSDAPLDEFADAFGGEDSESLQPAEPLVVGSTPFEIEDPLNPPLPAQLPSDASGYPEPESRQGEPSLPDGTPCGAVEESRREASGNGAALRAHYAWQVYNDCFTPIVIRWTFRGDGLLDSQRTIPARGSQSLGCSTPAGSLSGRYCTGGLEYLFEWP